MLAAAPLAATPLTAPLAAAGPTIHDYNLPLTLGVKAVYRTLTVRAGGSLTVQPIDRSVQVDG